ncbi:MAG: metal-dependent hydrolase [Pseudomonadota bacterium]
MFVGHYAAAVAARAVEPRAPLWSYVAACQLLDIGWGALVMAGIERFDVDPALPGSPLDLHHMPWTHSLPAALAWSAGGALAARGLLKVPWRAAAMVGAAVFSHWLLDALVHRPDLEIWPGVGKVGLGWWNWPVPEATLEMGLLAAAGAGWGWARAREGRSVWPAAAFLLLLTAVQVASKLTPPAADPVRTGSMAIGVYLAVAAVAWVVERRPGRVA